MAYITRYGSIWGQIPNTAGQVFWVAPAASYTVNGQAYEASNNNDGLTPQNAKLTLASAVTAATANAGDVIVLLPGAHSWAASVAASKAGLTITGLPSGLGNQMRHKTSITTTADDEIINVTAADVEIAYLHIIPVTTKAGIDFTTAANRLHVHDCSIDLHTAAASTSTVGVGVTAIGQAPSDVHFKNVYSLSDGAQGPAISVGDTFGSLIEDCEFVVRGGAWASALNVDGVTSAYGTVLRCIFRARQGTMTIGITGGTDDASTGNYGIYNCLFDENVTTPIDNFGTECCNIAENYRASADGTAEGGLLWSSTT